MSCEFIKFTTHNTQLTTQNKVPHSIIEHSFPIPKDQSDALLLMVNQTISKNAGNFNIYKCEARMAFRENFMIGSGDMEKDFIHITVKILEGRSLDMRQNLAENILKIIGDFLHEKKISINSLSFSVVISEMTKESYQSTMINRINL
ncbi:MAG: 5-carboxymethyl-2-hydroxymuconate isomerase [Rickettsiales bacterium]|jgi:5-carboxymethyl-2-hydroxymuconate isomerase